MHRILRYLALTVILFIMAACNDDVIDNDQNNEEPSHEEPSDENRVDHPPVFIGLEDRELIIGDSFDPLENVEAIDVEDGDISHLIVVLGIQFLPLDDDGVLTQSGMYHLIYHVVDSNLNSVEEEIVITIRDHHNVSTCNYVREGYILTWCDDFTGVGENVNDRGINLDKWGFQLGTGSQYGLNGWGNYEQQYYRSENARVYNNQLIIEAKLENYGGMPYTSSRLYTRYTFSQTYGRFEAMIKLPIGQGLWPAFWLMPKDSVYGGWANSGEIDIMEARGRFPNEVSSAIHYGGPWPHNTYTTENYYFPPGENISNYHLYAVEWDENEMRFYVNDVLYHTVNDWYNTGYDYPAPFDQPFYIILNLAIGGTFDGNRTPPNSLFDNPVEMEVSFVRVYQRVED